MVLKLLQSWLNPEIIDPVSRTIPVFFYLPDIVFFLDMAIFYQPQSIQSS